MYDFLDDSTRLVFDVGALGGGLAHQCAKVGIECVSIEPLPEAYEAILKIMPDAIVIQKALGTEPGRADLTICGTLSTMVPEKWFGPRSRFRHIDTSGTVEVEVTTLDELIAEYGKPDFVKIDVEGYELEVLKGLSQPVPLLSFEYTPPFYKDAAACLDHLVGLGMKEYNYRDGDGWGGFKFDWGHRIMPKLPPEPSYGMLFARES